MAVTKYIYDGDTVLHETDGAGAVLRTYTHDPGGYGDLLSAYDGTAARYFEPDALGSTDALADQSQTVTARWRYRAFGSATQTLGTDSTPFTWVGRQGYYADSQTGLYQLGNGTRYYDPQTAQFVSPDPVGLAGGDLNLRRYVRNNPIRAIDPSGLYTADCTWENGGKTKTVTIKCDEKLYPSECCEKERVARGLVGWTIKTIQANDRGLVRAIDCETTCKGYMKYHKQMCADKIKNNDAYLACCQWQALKAVDICMEACLPKNDGDPDDVVAGEQAFVDFFFEQAHKCKQLTKFLRWIPFLVCLEREMQVVTTVTISSHELVPQ